MENEMVEIRWASDASMEYRSKLFYCDSDGNICGFTWGPWRIVMAA